MSDEEYEYGYDYDDNAGSEVYGEGMTTEISSTFAPVTYKASYVSRTEHQTVQRVIELARDLGKQIGYERADAECLVLLAASQFDMYQATQLVFDESSLVARNLANGENNLNHYLFGWDDPRKGLLAKNTEDAECSTCYVDLKPGEGRTFCTHFLCKDCLQTKLTVHRTEWNQGKLVLRCEDVKKPTCLGMTCISNIEIDITSFLGEAFSTDYLPKHRYQWCRTLPSVSIYPGVSEIEVSNADGKRIKDEFKHSRFIPCGTDECSGVFEVERDLFEKKTAESIVGKCGECTKRTCFLCQSKEHNPASCAAIRQWQLKESDEGLNVQWMLVHTKACPKCHSQIEKNEGCNHMTCKKCTHEFCWICMGLWSKHGSSYYECNRLAKDDKKERNVADAKTSLARYTHFYDRHRNHMNSVRLDEKTMQAVSRYVQANFTGGNINYLEDVAKTLFDCRYTLANTYIYGYFETGNTEIFEFNQGRLERATEDLSEIVEKCRRGAEMGKSQQEIQNKAAIAKQYLEILRKGI